MKTWLDLESRFRALAPALQFCHLDAQWGAAGEHWYVTGTAAPAARQEYELLCGVAGQFLERAYSPKVPEQAALLAIPNTKIRWYTLLKQFSPHFGDLIYGEHHNEDGSSAGFIYAGTLRSIAESSANLCLALQANHPIIEPKSKWQWFHDNYVKAIVVGIILTLAGATIKLFFG